MLLKSLLELILNIVGMVLNEPITTRTYVPSLNDYGIKSCLLEADFSKAVEAKRNSKFSKFKWRSKS